jgi:aspartate ammonia-lyase
MGAREKFRIERDTVGEVRVPADALYGAQTQRAVENFPVSGLREHPVFIHAFVLLKKAAAMANAQAGALDARIAEAIASSCDEILGDGSKQKYLAPGFAKHFVVDVFQAGAGTSFNMNCNEVIANMASRSLGSPVDPNDHVNMAQSTNDTFPTATRVAILLLLRELDPHLVRLSTAFADKGREFADIIKSGRTHLQDAVPVTLGQEFTAYGEAIRRATRLLRDASDELRELGIGGTATGTGINTPPGFRETVVDLLAEMTELNLEPSDDLREAMQSQLPVSAVSAALRNLALELTRITNDLRLLASGPHTGLAEIILPTVQPGSSIMPGKVNPSILECMNQVCFHIIGADAAVSYAVQAGQLELNVMMPLMAFETLFSIDILKNFVPVYIDRCIAGIEADLERCRQYYITSPALATALNPIIGYARAAEIAKESATTGVPIPDLLRRRKILSDEEIARIFTPEFLAGHRGTEE